jgi:RNA polymerase sigma factor for flagellar operon FliA
MNTAVPTQAPDDSRDHLVEAHLHLVDSIARKHRSYGLGSGIEFDDLVAYGRIGLLDAATRFDTTKGVPFEAFARRRIRGEMIDGIRRDGWFGRRAYRRPRAGIGGIVERAANDPGSPVVLPAGLVILHAEQVDGGRREDLRAEIAKGGEAGDGVRWNGKRMVQVPVEDDDALDALLQELTDNLSLLPARQRRLLDLCCCQSKTLSQAAVEMDLCISWASRLRAQALATLRAAMQANAERLRGHHQQHSRSAVDNSRVDCRSAGVAPGTSAACGGQTRVRRA